MAIATLSTQTLRPVQRTTKASRSLTPVQLAEYIYPSRNNGNHLTLARLKNGPKANVIIGQDGDRFIGIEGASIWLLAHFSPYAKKKLLDERASNLSIPNGSKQTIQWIYKYMQAGEIDAHDQDKFEWLSVDSLVLLYTHSAFLEYKSLMDRALGRLKGKYYDVLPTVDEIKTFQVCVPPLYDHAVSILADEMANPWACSYSAYSELAISDQAFCDKLENTIKDLLARRVEASEKYYATTKNRQVLWSKQYYENVKNAKVDLTEQDMSKREVVNLPEAVDSKSKDSPPPKKKRGGRKADTRKSTKPHESTLDKHDAPSEAYIQGSKALKSKPVNRFNCFYCGEEGHIAHNCTTKATDTLKAADKAKETKRPALTCYNCNEEGHIARNCEVSAPINISPRRDSTGRNRNSRRAQNDRFARRIDVTGNGEGIRTCDREVRKGEVTRTGLII
jgi:hypothetical protein